MGAQQLGRIVDPASLEHADGARGRVQIEVPPAWLSEPCSIDLEVPERLVCARCDGGGCDGCGRSGAVSAPRGGTVRVPLPRADRDVAIRLAHPFGPAGGLAQIIVEVRRGARPSPGVTRLLPRDTPREGRPPSRKLALPGGFPAIAAAALATAAALLAALLSR